MKVLFTYMLTCVMLISFALSMQAQNGDWDLKKDKEGIKVYTRPLEDSALDEFKSEGIVDASVDEIVALLKDVDIMTEWVPDCIEGELLKMEDNDQYHYALNKNSVPCKEQGQLCKIQLPGN